MKQLISLLIENKPGALMRVTGVLTARGYNIESLTVARTLDSTLSSMTIVVGVDPTMQFLLIKQIKRLVNVVEVVDLTESRAICRELVLVKIETMTEKRALLLKEIDSFGARIAETDSLSYTLEVTGTSDDLDSFISLLHSYRWQMSRMACSSAFACPLRDSVCVLTKASIASLSLEFGVRASAIR